MSRVDLLEACDAAELITMTFEVFTRDSSGVKGRYKRKAACLFKKKILYLQIFSTHTHNRCSGLTIFWLRLDSPEKTKSDECVCVCVFTFLIYISENSDDLEGKTRFPVLIN